MRERDAPRAARQPFLAEILDGARHAATHPVIREAMLLSGLLSITVRGVIEILPAIADGTFGRGARGLGEMLAASGAGALIAAIIIALRRAVPSESGISLAARASIAGGVLGTVVLGVTDNWLVALSMVFLLGFCFTVNGIDLQTSVQLSLTDAYRGRVMSLWIVLVIGGAAMSAIALGFLADLFGMAGTLVGAGVVCAALAGAVMVGLARWRRSPPAAR